jgi:nucleotide-binding universal stress UspA family protein
MMYQTILVPLDGSQLAETALPYAEELSVRLGSDVTLIYVSQSIDDPHQHMHQIYMRKMAESTKQDAEAYARKLGKELAIQVRSVNLAGNPAEEIVKYADSENVGLIIMSTHGQSGIRQWTIGSIANKVVRSTKRPVALIRAEGASHGVLQVDMPKKILLPLDGSKESEAAIPYVAELASSLGMSVILLQVLAIGDKALAEDYLEKIGVQLKQKGVTVESQVRFGEAATEIVNLAAEIHAGVVAMSIHGRSGVGRWVLGSVAERVLYEGNTPLLLVRRTVGNK